MKILSTHFIPTSRQLHEQTMGDTHKELSYALTKVDAGMRSLGLTPATIGVNKYGRSSIEGWRTIQIVFGLTHDDLINSSPNNLKQVFKDCYYQRDKGHFILTETNGFGTSKSISFHLNDVVSDPTIDDIYEIFDLQYNGLGNQQVTQGYGFMIFQKIVASRKGS